MDQQDYETLLWAREKFFCDSRAYNKKIIFGHTPTFYLGNQLTPQWLNDGNDIAIILHLPETTVRSYVARARKMLRDKIIKKGI